MENRNMEMEKSIAFRIICLENSIAKKRQRQRYERIENGSTIILTERYHELQKEIETLTRELDDLLDQ